MQNPLQKPPKTVQASRVYIEIINTGSELLLGRVLNTHQQFLARRLADLGCPPRRQICVSDSGEEIETAVREASARADIIITTGGLGPTSDDRTRDRLAAMLNRKLVRDDATLQRIRQWFEHRGRPMPESTAVQALVPEGARILPNDQGTAPGLLLEIQNACGGHAKWLLMLPGPPRELRPMFDQQVMPWLKEVLHGTAPFVCLTLKTTGIGESRVEEAIAPHLADLVEKGLGIGYCARTGEVDVRFVAEGPDAVAQVAQAEKVTRRLLKLSIFGTGDEQLEQVVVRMLAERDQWLALAESCTGGYIANRITNVPGASGVLWGGGVTYANEAKERLLGVSSATLRDYGAVSEECAREMAERIKNVAGSTFGLAVTGIAGPTGGSAEKPVGTVFVALASPAGVTVHRFLNKFDRETFKYVTSQQALDLLRRAVLASK